MANVAPPGLNQFFDANGNPLAFGQLSTFDAGTSTPRLTWSDAGETVPNANPIVLDSAGRAQIFYKGNYKLVMKDQFGATQWTVDGFNIPDVAAANAAIQWQVAGGNVGSPGTFSTIDLHAGFAATPSGSSLVITIGDATASPTFASLTLVGGLTAVSAALSGGLTVSGGAVSFTGVAAGFFPRVTNMGNTNYNLTLADCGSYLFSQAITSPKAVNLPANATVAFPFDTIIFLDQDSVTPGTGTAHILTPAGGVTVNGTPGSAIVQVSTNVWAWIL